MTDLLYNPVEIIGQLRHNLVGMKTDVFVDECLGERDRDVQETTCGLLRCQIAGENGSNSREIILREGAGLIVPDEQPDLLGAWKLMTVHHNIGAPFPTGIAVICRSSAFFRGSIPTEHLPGTPDSLPLKDGSPLLGP